MIWKGKYKNMIIKFLNVNLIFLLSKLNKTNNLTNLLIDLLDRYK